MSEPVKKETTKVCPHCGNKNLARLTSLNYKYCVVCNKQIPWYLEPNQKPLFE